MCQYLYVTRVLFPVHRSLRRTLIVLVSILTFIVSTLRRSIFATSNILCLFTPQAGLSSYSPRFSINSFHQTLSSELPLVAPTGTFNLRLPLHDSTHLHPSQIHTHRHHRKSQWNNDRKTDTTCIHQAQIFFIAHTQRTECTLKTMQQMPAQRNTSQHINDHHPFSS